MFKFNPFGEYGIADYSQYKKYPFLENGSNKGVISAIKGQVMDNFNFPERLLILGSKGAGKTSTLFYIRDLLEKVENVNIFFFSKLISSNTEFFDGTKMELADASKNPTFILIDFPDSPNKTQFRAFLEYIWNLMIYKNYQNIHFIIAMNISLYNQSLAISEVLGKFYRQRLEKLREEETKELIKSRLGLSGNPKFFDEGVYELIHQYSKGIPRNVICAGRTLVDCYREKKKVSLSDAKKVIREDYIRTVINDRVEDERLRQTYLDIVRIIKDEFGGEVKKQTELIDTINKITGTGRNRCIKLIDELSHFGILSITRGGRNNAQKIMRIL